MENLNKIIFKILENKCNQSNKIATKNAKWRPEVAEPLDELRCVVLVEEDIWEEGFQSGRTRVPVHLNSCESC